MGSLDSASRTLPLKQQSQGLFWAIKGIEKMQKQKYKGTRMFIKIKSNIEFIKLI